MTTKYSNEKSAIGGYFELELNKGKEYHKNAIGLNTGRNCIEYILRVRKYKKVYMPYYTCDVILEPLEKTNTKYEFYNIDNNFEPVDVFLQKNEALLYINYFGIKGNVVKKLAKEYKNLIIDNSQAFFEKPIINVDTFYSPRKFFGVPDGGYLFINQKLKLDFKQDLSYSRLKHLLIRIDKSAEYGYKFFKDNDKILSNQPIKYMSILTRKILSGMNYEKIASIRKNNFLFLHENLKDKNKLRFDVENSVPLVYPLLIINSKIRRLLIKNRVFVAKYWENVKKWSDKSSLEYEFTNNIFPLPIDQRYTIADMQRLLEIIGKI